MSVKFQDYYETLEVSRTASKEEISKSFRKLARKYHPDLNKTKEGEERFKQINEAYEVLSDPEKRKKYDQLGSNWKAGQDFQAPPGWENIFANFGGAAGAKGKRSFNTGAGGASFSFGGSGFSDFFDTLFGGSAGSDFSRQANNRSFFSGGNGNQGFEEEGEDLSSTINISLEEAFNGASKTISLASGTKTKQYKIKIPAGTTQDQTIRLANMGTPGSSGGRNGDLLLKVNIQTHPRYKLEGKDISTELPISPWEAILGGKVEFETLSGNISLNVPAESQSGKRFRLKGKGMPSKTGLAGDFYVELKIVVPEKPSEKERELFSQLASTSKFNPRAN